MRCLTGPLAGPEQLSATDLEVGYAVDSPSLRANMVASLDGVVALDGVSGALGGPDDVEVFATLRALSDVVVVGAGTLRAEGYGPAWLTAERRARRAARGQAPLPTVAVVTAHADLDPGWPLFTERRQDQPEPPRPYVFTADTAPADRLRALDAVATVVSLGERHVDPAAMVTHLVAEGLSRALCEGGPTLLGQLIALDLVDDLCLTQAPLFAGPGHRTLSGGPEGTPFATAARFRLLQLIEGDGLLLARYGRERPGEGRGASVAGAGTTP
jgi:riboflavin biosynthesis pyrimidine reductase